MACPPLHGHGRMPLRMFALVCVGSKQGSWEELTGTAACTKLIPQCIWAVEVPHREYHVGKGEEKGGSGWQVSLSRAYACLILCYG